MATNPVNLVDAIADVIPRIATARTATLRTGRVVSVTGGTAMVALGGAVDADAIACRFHTFYTPVVGHIVSLITEKDVWLIMGQLKT